MRLGGKDILYNLSEHGLLYSNKNPKIPGSILSDCNSVLENIRHDPVAHMRNNHNFTLFKQPLLYDSFAKIVLLDEVLKLPFLFFEGRDFFLGTVNLRSSKETAYPETTTTLFHRDQNLGSLKSTRGNFLKVFVYLTDVSHENGPFTYIVGSNKNQKEDSNKYRIPDEEVYKMYGNETEIKCIAPAGSIISADTTGLHKGTKVKKGYRDMFTINFCTKKEKNTEMFQIKRSFKEKIEKHKIPLFRYYSEV